MKAILTAAIFVTVLFCPRLASACSCLGTNSVCKSLDKADAVFIGTVIKDENHLTKIVDGVAYLGLQTAYVQVDEAFKGAKESVLIFRSGGGSCDRQLKEGERWLFYANYNKESKRYGTYVCDRSTRLERAGADLAYLRALPRSAQKTYLSGELRSDFTKPLMGVKVKVSDGNQSYETFTDKNGVYEFVGLPPGTYSVQPETPLSLKVRLSSLSLGDNAPDSKPLRVDLKEKSCANFSFYYSENTSIAGKVFGADGRPLPKVCLDLQLKENPSETRYLADCTEEDGSFKIEEIPLGDYLLVANKDGKISSYEPFPPTYYPGVLDKEKATVLTIATGNQIQDADVHIATERPTRTIEGRLLFSDGKPVDQESVEFTPGTAGEKESVHTFTDAQGRFRLPILEGMKGSLRGFMYTYSGEFENCPQLEKLLKSRSDIQTNVIKLEANRDFSDIELIFPFPYCVKAKDPQ